MVTKTRLADGSLVFETDDDYAAYLAEMERVVVAIVHWHVDGEKPDRETACLFPEYYEVLGIDPVLGYDQE